MLAYPAILAGLLASLLSAAAAAPAPAPAPASDADHAALVSTVRAFLGAPTDAHAEALRALAPEAVAAALDEALPFRGAPPEAKGKVVVGGERDYYLYELPDDYDPARSWPLIVSLHGTPRGHCELVHRACWRGDAAREGFLLISPHYAGGIWRKPEGGVALRQALFDAVTRFHVDWRRIYLDGYSSGGVGVWTHGTQWADLFAGIVVRCGVRRVDDETTGNLRESAAFVLHGRTDDRAPPANALAAVAALQRLDVPHEYVEYGGSHGCYARTNDRILRFLAGQQKDAAPATFRQRSLFDETARMVHFVAVEGAGPGGRVVELRAERSAARVAVQVDAPERLARLDVFFSDEQLRRGGLLVIEVNGTRHEIVPRRSVGAFVRAWRLAPFYAVDAPQRVYFAGATVLLDGAVLAEPRPL